MLSRAYNDTTHETQSLRGSYFCYFLAVLVMMSTAWFITQGIQATEPDSPARHAKVASGVLLLVLEGCVFSLAGQFQRHAFILRLLGWSIFVLQIVLMTLANYSIGATAGKAAALNGDTVAEVKTQAEASRKAAKFLQDSADKLNKSKHGWLNQQGGQTATAAAAQTAAASGAVSKLQELKVGVSTPLVDTIGTTGLMVLSGAWSLVLELAGIALMHVAGSLRREASASAGAQPVNVQILELLHRVHGAPVAPATSAEIAAPALSSFKSVVPSAKSANGPSYSSKMTFAGAGAGALAAMAAPAMAHTAPAVPISAPEPAHTDAPSAPVPAQSVSKKRSAVQVGAKLDTGTTGNAATRYNRIKLAVQSGKLKPSTRAVQAAEGGGGDVVKAYLQQLEKDGVTVRAGRGYALKGGAK